MTRTGYERVYQVVRRIPYGQAATYGQVARLVCPPCTAREVGRALAALRHHNVTPPVPWHRVLNARGTSSIGAPQVQRLEDEGVQFDAEEKVDFNRFGWSGF